MASQCPKRSVRIGAALLLTCAASLGAPPVTAVAATATPSPTVSACPTDTVSPTASASPTPTASPSPTATASSDATDSECPTPTGTAAATGTATGTASAAATATGTASASASPTTPAAASAPLVRPRVLAKAASCPSLASLPVPAAASTVVGSGGDLGTTYYVTNTFDSSAASTAVTYGKTQDLALAGDWDGNGRDSLGLRRQNIYFLRNSLSAGSADVVVAYGRATDQVLVGDWDGNGTDTLTIRRGNQYFLSNCFHGGEADQTIAYGTVSDTVLVGDWDGDGKDTLAVRRGSTYYIKNSIAGGQADKVIAFGTPSDQVLVGDWDGDGKDTLAVRRGSTYYIKNSIAGGQADRTVVLGRPTDQALVGDWDGNRTYTLALRRPPAKPKPVQTLFTFNVAWAGQPNGFFCGPTSGYMILRYLGASRSRATGASLTIENVATAMQTRRYGYTSFNDRRFQGGMNAWLGKNVYSTIHTPSAATVRSEVLGSFKNGYPIAVDEQERRGGPHFNGHSNSTFSHIMVVTGYNSKTDAIRFADPGATLWASAAHEFWYPSLSTFVSTYLAHEYVNDGRQHIGIYTS